MVPPIFPPLPYDFDTQSRAHVSSRFNPVSLVLDFKLIKAVLTDERAHVAMWPELLQHVNCRQQRSVFVKFVTCRKLQSTREKHAVLSELIRR